MAYVQIVPVVLRYTLVWPLHSFTWAPTHFRYSYAFMLGKVFALATRMPMGKGSNTHLQVFHSSIRQDDMRADAWTTLSFSTPFDVFLFAPLHARPFWLFQYVLTHLS